MPIKIVNQDITKIECDAIVNPTNVNMRPTGGLDAAIHKAAGAELLEYCRTLGRLSVGEARITPAFNLPCRFVIHTVGPKWCGGLFGESALLRSCYEESMRLAIDNGCSSVAFPLIASGAHGYPKGRVLKEAVAVISRMLDECEMDVYIVIYDKSAYSVDSKIYEDLQRFVSVLCGNERSRTHISRSEASDCCMKSRGAETRFSETLCDLDNSERRFVRPENGEAEVAYRLISLDEMLREMDKGFADTLFYYIDKKQITDVEAYKRSNVSKKTFSKIKCNGEYRPSKETAVSFAIGLHLNLDETKHLLSTVGMCLSRSNKFDVVIEYFIITGRYETIFDVNEVLYQLDLPLLGV